MKKLMILGAGIYQVPLIKKARDMGLYTIVVSVDGPYPGFALADKVLKYDTRDTAGILAAAREEGIDGIVTTGTDVAMKTIGTVCDALGLTGISAEAAKRLTDKADMKTAFAGKVSTSPFSVVKTLAEAKDAADRIGYPVMVKACDVSGSRGISKVNDPAGLEEAFDYAMAATHTDHLIVEKAVEGYEIGLDGFVRHGQTVLCLPHDKHVARCAHSTVPAGHSFPFKGNEALQAAIRREFDAIVAATGLNNCAVNADVFVTGEDTVSVIEAGGRCGATTIPELITIYTGMDYYEGMIHTALGEDFDFTPTRAVPCMGRLLISPVTGVITAVDEAGLQAIRDEGIDFSLDYGVGDKVYQMKDGTDRIGQVIMASDDEREIEAVMDRILSCLTISQE
ncbi:MAG: ATP-grasp domain-containing protein [Lachnospiraceae bacterium]|nr:ATP-grasp domain-containing protein [Lachnospiraceae bacterium]